MERNTSKIHSSLLLQPCGLCSYSCVRQVMYSRHNTLVPALDVAAANFRKTTGKQMLPSLKTTSMSHSTSYLVHITIEAEIMSNYKSSFPEGQQEPALAQFFEQFYAISDTPDGHEKYAAQFTENATLIMVSKKVQGRSSMWKSLYCQLRVVVSFVSF